MLAELHLGVLQARCDMRAAVLAATFLFDRGPLLRSPRFNLLHSTLSYYYYLLAAPCIYGELSWCSHTVDEFTSRDFHADSALHDGILDRSLIHEQFDGHPLAIVITHASTATCMGNIRCSERMFKHQVDQKWFM
jgi:hypothetical protein